MTPEIIPGNPVVNRYFFILKMKIAKANDKFESQRRLCRD